MRMENDCPYGCSSNDNANTPCPHCDEPVPSRLPDSAFTDDAWRDLIDPQPPARPTDFDNPLGSGMCVCGVEIIRKGEFAYPALNPACPVHAPQPPAPEASVPSMTDREKARDLGNQSAALARSIADVLNDALDALEAAEAEVAHLTTLSKDCSSRRPSRLHAAEARVRELEEDVATQSERYLEAGRRQLEAEQRLDGARAARNAAREERDEAQARVRELEAENEILTDQAAGAINEKLWDDYTAVKEALRKIAYLMGCLEPDENGVSVCEGTCDVCKARALLGSGEGQ